MSSKAGKLSKAIKNKLMFPQEMYETFIGSALICNYIFEQWPKEEKQRVIKKWKTIKRNPSNYFDFESTWNINKIYEVFEVKRTWNYPVCMVTSEFNALVLPYATDEDKVIPLPVREDALLPLTARKAKTIQVIDWEGDLIEKDKSESAS